MEQFFATLGFVVTLFGAGILIGLLFMVIRNRIRYWRALVAGQTQQVHLAQQAQLNQNFKNNVDALWRHIDRAHQEECLIYNKLAARVYDLENPKPTLRKVEPRKVRKTKTR